MATGNRNAAMKGRIVHERRLNRASDRAPLVRHSFTTRIPARTPPGTTKRKTPLLPSYPDISQGSDVTNHHKARAPKVEYPDPRGHALSCCGLTHTCASHTNDS